MPLTWSLEKLFLSTTFQRKVPLKCQLQQVFLEEANFGLENLVCIFKTFCSSTGNFHFSTLLMSLFTKFYPNFLLLFKWQIKGIALLTTVGDSRDRFLSFSGIAFTYERLTGSPSHCSAFHGIAFLFSLSGIALCIHVGKLKVHKMTVRDSDPLHMIGKCIRLSNFCILFFCS